MTRKNDRTAETIRVIKMGMVIVWLIATIVCAALDQPTVFVAVFAFLLMWTAFSFGIDLAKWQEQDEASTTRRA